MGSTTIRIGGLFGAGLMGLLMILLPPVVRVEAVAESVVA